MKTNQEQIEEFQIALMKVEDQIMDVEAKIAPLNRLKKKLVGEKQLLEAKIGAISRREYEDEYWGRHTVVAKLREGGATIGEIAIRYNISKDRVRNMLRKYDHHMRLEKWRKDATKNGVTKDSPINVLNVGVRAANVLNNTDHRTIGGLCEMTRGELRKYHGCGNKVLLEIEQALLQHGFTLAA